jgi:hypothetical protein
MTTTDFDSTHSSSLCNGKDLNGHAVLQQEKHRLQNPSPTYRRHAIALAVGWLALNLRPQGLSQISKNPVSRSSEQAPTTDTEAVASLLPESITSLKGGNVYEFCLPKPPSMTSVVSVVCVKAKQR